MAVDNQHKFAFIHVPKTGGVTIEKELSLVNHDGHRGYIYYKNRYPDYDIHAIVRNPYDRYISSFMFMLEYGEKPKKYYDRYRHYTDHGLYGCIKLINSEKRYKVTQALKHQYRFLQTLDGDIECKIHRFEDFYNTYKYFCGLIKLDPKEKLPKHNKTNHLDYREYYKKEPKLQEEVYNYYIDDFKKFNYSKEL